MAPFQLVLLLSVGSFQAFVPGVTKAPSPVFADSEQGLAAFTTWATRTLPEAGFNQPPLKICVVGAVPFGGKTPYVAKPIWESHPPVRTLEPYSATFHYVDVKAGDKPPKPRSLQDAIALCAKPGA